MLSARPIAAEKYAPALPEAFVSIPLRFALVWAPWRIVPAPSTAAVAMPGSSANAQSSNSKPLAVRCLKKFRGMGAVDFPTRGDSLYEKVSPEYSVVGYGIV